MLLSPELLTSCELIIQAQEIRTTPSKLTCMVCDIAQYKLKVKLKF